jgi:hypothetical protein
VIYYLLGLLILTIVFLLLIENLIDKNFKWNPNKTALVTGGSGGIGSTEYLAKMDAIINGLMLEQQIAKTV